MTNKQIESLTPEQEARMPDYVRKWIGIGLDTSEVQLDEIISAVKQIYAQVDQKQPEFFMLADGPTEAMRFISHADKVDLTFDQMRELTALELTAEVRKQIDATVPAGQYTYQVPEFYGQHDAGFLSFYDFFAEELNIGKQELAALKTLTINSGWVWMYENLVIFSRKPIHVSVDNTGRLHNEKRAAIEYLDGTKVYSFNGVRIPEKWVLERDTMDPSEIFACSDVDQRAAGIALYGYSRLKDRLDYNVVEGDPNTDIGALVEITIPGLRTKGRFLEAICPRNGPVFLGVPANNPWDNNRPIKTAVAAQAFLARLPESAYQHPPIRT